MKTVEYSTLDTIDGASKRAFEILMKTISEQYSTIDRKLTIRSVVMNCRVNNKTE